MSLFSFYTYNFQLKQHHGWTITELEEMIPWEREIYMLQLQKWISEENQRRGNLP